MPSNSKDRTRELDKYIKLYIHEGVGYRKLCKEYGLLLERSNFNNKILRYQEDGLIGIQSSRRDNHYSKDFKHPVVMEYIEEGVTMKGLARKYNKP